MISHYLQTLYYTSDDWSGVFFHQSYSTTYWCNSRLFLMKKNYELHQLSDGLINRVPIPSSITKSFLYSIAESLWFQILNDCNYIEKYTLLWSIESICDKFLGIILTDVDGLMGSDIMKPITNPNYRGVAMYRKIV